MKILSQLLIIFFVFWISQGIAALLPFPLPASVVGLILLLTLLLTGLLKVEWIREVVDFLQSHLTLFIIPVAVSAMNYVDVIMENALGFFMVSILSTAITYGAVVWAVHLTCKLMGKGEDAE